MINIAANEKNNNFIDLEFVDQSLIVRVGNCGDTQTRISVLLEIHI